MELLPPEIGDVFVMPGNWIERPMSGPMPTPPSRPRLILEGLDDILQDLAGKGGVFESLHGDLRTLLELADPLSPPLELEKRVNAVFDGYKKGIDRLDMKRTLQEDQNKVLRRLRSLRSSGERRGGE